MKGREIASLFALERQLKNLFTELKGSYDCVLLNFQDSGHPFDISFSSEELMRLFDIILEAVDNSLRHSKATIIETEIHVLNNSLLQFSVSDNGNGFELDSIAEHKKYSGIKRMCDYAHQIDARVVFDSTLGRGTQVVVAKPVEKQKARFYTRLIALF